MRLAPALLASALVSAEPAQASADACDALTVQVIRLTGASLVGRDGTLVVFRAADAERMSLDCRTPRQVLISSRRREPPGAYFVLIGLAAQALVGGKPAEVETLARRLHQETLLTGASREGRAGPVRLRCEPGDRIDGSSRGTLCRLAPDRPPLRRRAGLFEGAPAG